MAATKSLTRRLLHYMKSIHHNEIEMKTGLPATNASFTLLQATTNFVILISVIISVASFISGKLSRSLLSSLGFGVVDLRLVGC